MATRALPERTGDLGNAQGAAPGLLASIAADIGCVQARDPAAGGKLEILLTYPGVHAIIWYRIAHRLWTRRLRFTARLVSWFARAITNIEIHPAATIGQRFFIDHGAGVVIGETSAIGDDVTLYHGVTLGGTSWAGGKRHPTIENGVLIGAGAKILGPITVAEGARVGANSVVVESVPAKMTVVGIPGRIVRDASDRRIIGQRIDLDHHLMPDPVGEALSMLLDRIDFLEARLAHRDRLAGRGDESDRLAGRGDESDRLAGRGEEECTDCVEEAA